MLDMFKGVDIYKTFAFMFNEGCMREIHEVTRPNMSQEGVLSTSPAIIDKLLVYLL